MASSFSINVEVEGCSGGVFGLVGGHLGKKTLQINPFFLKTIALCDISLSYKNDKFSCSCLSAPTKKSVWFLN